VVVVVVVVHKEDDDCRIQIFLKRLPVFWVNSGIMYI